MKIERITTNGFQIDLPIGLPMTKGMRINDAYQDFLQTDYHLVLRHLNAITQLIPRMDNPENVLHPFAGLGATLQVMEQAFPDAVHVMWERDRTCVDYLRASFGWPVAHVEDSYKALICQNLLDTDTVILDPSIGTIKTEHMKGVWAALSNNPNIRNIWLTDSSPSRMHINHKFYAKDFMTELPSPNKEGYIYAYDSYLRRIGFQVKAAATELNMYIYMLIGRDDGSNPLTIDIIEV